MSDPKRIGLFGGTFDPIHKTHTAIARAALAEAGLDCVVFVVAARPPHKEDGPLAGAEDRYAMVRAAIEGEPRMQVSRAEFERDGPSYTVDTLREFHARYPEAGLFLIAGYDSLLDMPQWRDLPGILSLATILAAPRPGPRLDAPPELEGHYDVLSLEETALSSTLVRDRILAGERFDDMVAPPVAKLIREKGIYDARCADLPR